MKPDVIVSWPRNCDYPLWREQMEKNRERFGKIIIVLTLARGVYDCEEFIKSWSNTIPDCYAINSPTIKSGEDWRDVAVKYGLRHSDSEWVWFTEQDFYFIDDFWDFPEDPKFDYFGIIDNGRLHPCSLLIRRKIIDEMKPDFSANPPDYDHFGAVQRYLQNTSYKSRFLFDDGPEKRKLGEYNFVHFNGYSHNFRLVTDGELPNYLPALFINHVEQSLHTATMLDEAYIKIVKAAIKRFRDKNPVQST